MSEHFVCPEAENHGNPFRYCPVKGCGWSEAGQLPTDRSGAAESPCTCVPGAGCDAEGDPGCAYCQAVDPELPCPAEVEA